MGSYGSPFFFFGEVVRSAIPIVTTGYIAEIAIGRSKVTSMSKLGCALFALAVAAVGCSKGKSGDSGAALVKMRELKDEMCKCKDAKCAQDVSDKMTKWSQEQAKNQKEPPKMSAEDQKAAADLGDAIGKCMAAAMTTGAPAGSAAGSAGSAVPAGPPAPAAAAGDLPSECNDYKTAIDRLSTCEKMAPKAREALKKAFDDASAGWANLPADAKSGLAPACKAGTDAVVSAAKQTCGW